MTYIFDFAKNITKRNNIGLFIYLILNTILVVGLFSNGFADVGGIFFGVLVYGLSLAIALSPIGEWILRIQTGAKKIVRKEHLHRLEPLFNEVLYKAKQIDPSLPDDVQLFISDDKSANAFATGRKTVCLTKGFLDYTDEQIKAAFAHELGHLSHKDTDLILIISVGNMIVTTLFVLFRIMSMLTGIIFSFASRSFGTLITTILIDVVLVAMMWIWTKIGTMLVMHSSKQNEFAADEFALNCGYGDSLAYIIDTFDGAGNTGLWANLSSSHPDNDQRIAKLQELGSSYMSV